MRLLALPKSIATAGLGDEAAIIEIAQARPARTWDVILIRGSWPPRGVYHSTFTIKIASTRTMARS